MTKEEIEKYVIKVSGYHPDATFNDLGESQLKDALKMYDLLAKFSAHDNATLTSEVQRLKQEVEKLTKEKSLPKHYDNLSYKKDKKY